MTQITKEAIESLAAALEPFAAVAEHDIGADERAGDFFAPMKEYNRAPRLRVGDLRLAKAALDTFKQEIAPALPFLPIAVEGKVKALEWTQGDEDPGYHFAQSSIGNYAITDFPVVGDDQLTVRLLGTSQYGTWFRTLDEAKAAANDDYTKRVLACLTSSPGKDGGQEVEADKPVICIGRHTIDRLIAGEDVEIDAAIMIPASDLSAEPICHLVWRQGRISIDDVEDYYEVARSGDKSVDGSDPFPVFLQPASTALVEAGKRWRVFEDTTHGWWGIEVDGDPDADPILYPIKINRERLDNIVEQFNAR